MLKTLLWESITNNDIHHLLIKVFMTKATPFRNIVIVSTVHGNGKADEWAFRDFLSKPALKSSTRINIVSTGIPALYLFPSKLLLKPMSISLHGDFLCKVSYTLYNLVNVVTTIMKYKVLW